MADMGSTRRRFLGAAAGVIGVGTAIGSTAGERAPSRPPVAQRDNSDANTGHVVLTFDHASPSVYGTAFPILQEFGYPALLAVVTDRIPRAGRSPLGLDWLRELQSAGWEIGSHSASEHPDFTSLSEDAIARQCRQSKQWLRDHGFASEAAAIVYPYEGATERVADVARKYFAVGFGGPHRYGTEIVDPLLIGRVSGDDIEATKEAIDATAADGGVVAIMYHSVGVDNGRVSTAGFRETMAHIRSKGADLRVITPSTLDRLLAGESIEPSANRTTTNGSSSPANGTGASTASPSTNGTETPPPTRTDTPTRTGASTDTDTPTSLNLPTDAEATSPLTPRAGESTATRAANTTADRDTSAATAEPAGTAADRTAADGPGFGVFAALSGLAGWTAYRLGTGRDQ